MGRIRVFGLAGRFLESRKVVVQAGRQLGIWTVKAFMFILSTF